MKYVFLIPDGMADRPLTELDGKTPMQVAAKPNMNRLAKKGIVGSVQTVPEGLSPGSDVASMSLMGYDPRVAYTGRGPLEAASMGVDLDRKDVAFRCNLISTDGDRMLDYSAGHVTSEEARALIGFVAEKLSTSKIHFFPGVSYRHLLVWRNGSDNVHCTPPHDILGQPLESHLPEGDHAEELRRMIYDSLEILDNHEINRRRRDAGKKPANMIWPWSPGYPPRMETYASRFGITGAVVSAVDLIKGLGRYAGLRIINVPGATGYLDTNYVGKAQYALAALEELDFVLVHVEAPDEASHEGLLDKKIEAIEQVDRLVLGTLLEGIQKMDEPTRILIAPDHRTPIEVRTHTREPVPYLLYDIRETTPEQSLPFDERVVEEGAHFVDEGHRLMDIFLNAS